MSGNFFYNADTSIEKIYRIVSGVLYCKDIPPPKIHGHHNNKRYKNKYVFESNRPFVKPYFCDNFVFLSIPSK